MRNISASMTKAQVLDRSKFETRRFGWWDHMKGEARVNTEDRLRVVEKCMGLKKGEKHKELAIVEVVESWREPLDRISKAEVEREGFPDMTPAEFVAMFCKAMRCKPDTVVTVIWWSYVGGGES